MGLPSFFSEPGNFYRNATLVLILYKLSWHCYLSSLLASGLLTATATVCARALGPRAWVQASAGPRLHVQFTCSPTITLPCTPRGKVSFRHFFSYRRLRAGRDGQFAGGMRHDSYIMNALDRQAARAFGCARQLWATWSGAF